MDRNIKIYRLECINEDGMIEYNGYYQKKENAEIAKCKMDNQKMNSKYGIKQNIVEIETED